MSSAIAKALAGHEDLIESQIEQHQQIVAGQRREIADLKFRLMKSERRNEELTRQVKEMFLAAAGHVDETLTMLARRDDFRRLCDIRVHELVQIATDARDYTGRNHRPATVSLSDARADGLTFSLMRWALRVAAGERIEFEEAER